MKFLNVEIVYTVVKQLPIRQVNCYRAAIFDSQDILIN